MTDIKSPTLLYFKGGLMLMVGMASACLILMEHPGWKELFLLCLTVWGFCRAYYFAFYVIEHYIDPGFKFAGLTAWVRYVLSKSNLQNGPANQDRRANSLASQKRIEEE
jgi:hypothetical protein